MTVIGIKRLDDFRRIHTDTSQQIAAWLHEVEEAQWQRPQDIKTRFPTASILADNRVIFNIKGNKYRMDTIWSYRNQIVIVKRIGTHAEYSKWKF